MRYTDELGCRYRGIPHDLKVIHENLATKIEVCQICNKKLRWNKGHKQRIDNIKYLKAHVRQFAQRSGPTKRIYHKIYQPEKTIIYI